MVKSSVTKKVLLIQLLVSLAAVGFSTSWLFSEFVSHEQREIEDYTVNLAKIIDTSAKYSAIALGETSGVPVINLVTDAFQKLKTIGPSGSVFVLDRNSRAIGLRVYDEGGLFPDSARPLESSDRLVSLIQPAFSGSAGVVNTYDNHDHQIIVAYAPIPALDMALVMIVHKSEVYAPLFRSIFHILAVCATIIGAGLAATYFLTSSVVRRAQENESRFKRFTQSAIDWYWETDEDLRFHLIEHGDRPGVVPQFSNFIGKKRQDLTIDDITSDAWQEHLSAVNNRLRFKDFQYRILTNGEERTVLISGSPYFSDIGEFSGYRGTGRDITDILDFRLRLKEAEERIRATIDNITVGIIQINENCIIESLNPRAELIFGYSKEELIGKNINILMPTPDRDQHDAYVQKYHNTGHAKIIGIGREVQGLRKNGEIFPLHLGVAVLDLPGGRHFIGSITDLTIEKQLETQLRRAQKMDAVGQLTGGIAHDFNNLLGIIMGNLDLAARDLPADGKLKKYVEKANSAAERGANLTRRLLNFSRQDPTENQVVDINETLRDIRDLIQRSLRSDIRIELSLAEDSWPSCINKGDFEDALVNLAVNARDAMPDGGTLHIETTNKYVEAGKYAHDDLLEPGDYVQLTISDTGIGMDEYTASRIFEPFFTTKPSGKGTGLGMSLVYSFVQRSKGSISVYSEPGYGSTFVIRMPRAIVGDEADAAIAPAATSKTETPSIGNETILIVDDEEELAEVAHAYLSSLGYKTIVTSNASEALAVLQEDEPIHLLFSDVVMPGGMDGFELADQASAMRPGLKILMTSGFTAGAAQRNLDVNVNRYRLLHKPYGNRDLGRAVRDVLDGWRGA